MFRDKAIDKNLRLITAEIVVSSKLTNPAKLQLLNFIKDEASDSQVKALLLHGKIIKLNEEDAKIIDHEFENSPLLQEFILTGLILASAAIYKRFLSQAAKACKSFTGKTKSSCMNKFRIRGLEAQLSKLKSGATNCSKAEDPQKCRKKLSNKISKVSSKLSKLK